MHVRCPHCQNPIEIVGDSDITNVTCPSCGSAFNLVPETETYTPTSRSIGHFTLLEQLGSGGFGTVFKARDTKLDRFVAVKMPRRDQVEPENVEMFLREARAAAQLRHSNIVAVHEVGRDDDTLYIVSDFIQGVTLADRLTAGPFTPREAAELLVQIAEALHHAHEAGVIHRDLKPQNIMLDAAGQPHIMDFGLAKREAGEITMTVEGKILGTAAYMSPEQARGEGHSVNRRTDVYSLGVILFELLTGERPFRGNRAMLLHQVLHDEPPNPRKLNSRVPRDLATITLKCLEKDLRRRYTTAADVAAELRRWLDGQPILARPVGRFERTVRWARRQPLVATLLATVAVVTVIGFAAVTWQWRKAVAANTQAQENLEESDKQRIRRGVNFDRALEAVDKMLTHLGEQELLTPELTPVREKILQDALKLYEELLEEKADDPALRAETARAAMRVGAIRMLKRDPDQASIAYQQAIRLLDRLHAENAQDRRSALSLAICHYHVGQLFWRERRYSEAAESLQTAQRLVRPLIDQQIDPATESKNDDPVYFMMYSGNHLGEILLELNRPRDAVAVLREAIEIGERFQRPGLVLSALHTNLANHFEATSGNEREVDAALRRSMEILEVMQEDIPWWAYTYGIETRAGPESLHTTASTLEGAYAKYAAFLRRTGRGDEAAELDDKALRIRIAPIKKLRSEVAASTDVEKNNFNNQLLARYYREQGRLLIQQGKIREATEHLQNGLAYYVELAKEAPAVEYYRRTSFETSLEMLPLFYDDFDKWKSHVAESEAMLNALATLALTDKEVLQHEAKLFEAIDKSYTSVKWPKPSQPAVDVRIIQSSLEYAASVAKRMAARDENAAETLHALGWVHHKTGDEHFDAGEPREAILAFEEARKSWEKLIATHGLNPQRAFHLGWTYNNLVKARIAADEKKDLLPLALRALELREIVANRGDFEASFSLVADLLADSSDVRDADVQKVIDSARAQTTKDKSLASAWRCLRVASYRQEISRAGGGEQAVERLREASLHRKHASLLQREGKKAEAVEASRQAVEIYTQLAKESPTAAYLRREVIEAELETLPLRTQDVKDWNRDLALIETSRRELSGMETSVAEDLDLDARIVQAIADSIVSALAPETPPNVALEFRQRQLESRLSVAQRMTQRDKTSNLAKDALYWAQQKFGDFLLAAQPAEAVDHYREACRIREEMIADGGISVEHAWHLGWSCYKLSRAILSSKPSAEMLPAALRSLELREYLETARSDAARNREELERSFALIADVLARWSDVRVADVQKVIESARLRVTNNTEPGSARRALWLALYRRELVRRAAATEQTIDQWRRENPLASGQESATAPIEVWELVVRWMVGDRDAVFEIIEKRAQAPLPGAREGIGFEKTLASIRSSLNDSVWEGERDARELWEALSQRRKNEKNLGRGERL